MNRACLVCTAALSLTIATSSASAGLISISLNTLSTNGAEILNTGTLVSAWSVNDNLVLNGSPVTAPVVNGITFAAAQPSNITLASFGGIGTNSTATNAHYSGEMKKLMDDMLGTTSTLGDIHLTGLTIGDTYRVQFLHHQDETARLMGIRFNLTGPNQTPNFQAGGDQGYITTVLFVADSATQSFKGFAAGGNKAIINAVALFNLTPDPIPAPAALPAGLALMAMVIRRRVRR